MPHRLFNMKIDEVAVLSATSKTTWGGVLAGLFGWVSQINWIGLGGVVIAGIGVAGNLYFQKRRDQRERDLHRAQLDALHRSLPQSKSPQFKTGA